MSGVLHHHLRYDGSKSCWEQFKGSLFPKKTPCLSAQDSSPPLSIISVWHLRKVQFIAVIHPTNSSNSSQRPFKSTSALHAASRMRNGRAPQCRNPNRRNLLLWRRQRSMAQEHIQWQDAWLIPLIINQSTWRCYFWYQDLVHFSPGFTHTPPVGLSITYTRPPVSQRLWGQEWVVDFSGCRAEQ